MQRYAAFGLALIALIATVPARADPAPAGCEEHFFASDTPATVPARADETPRTLCFSQFALSHSGVTKTPVWVAEHLTRARVNKAARIARKNSFHAEKRLPKGERAEMKDYKGAGYDRGHM